MSGKYHLEEVLGIGGTATVFRARHRNGHRVAVKMLHEHLCTQSEITRRFMREAYLANILDHPGTVRVLDDDAGEDGEAFLVLELLEGETLEERRVRLGGRLPVDDVLGYMDRLLEVLELAHEKNIVHRDIKPSNLFLTKDGVLKVLDFGIARLLDDTAGATVTKTGQMIGTPAFMPPEQALSKAREIDAQTDLWAVGATMFTLLSGELVHVAESSSEHLVKAATEHARSVARVLPAIPAHVEDLVSRALQFDKSARWASATEMRHELWRVRLDPGHPLGTTSAPPPPVQLSSNFPTVINPKSAKARASVAPKDTLLATARDSGAREIDLSLTGMPRSDHPAKRAVVFSTMVAVLLVASALSFGIYILAAKPNAATGPTAGPAPLAATVEPAPVAALPPSAATAASEPPGAAVATAASTNGGTPASAPSEPSAKPVASVSAVSAGAAASARSAPSSPGAAGAAAAKKKRTGDLYRPF